MKVPAPGQQLLTIHSLLSLFWGLADPSDLCSAGHGQLVKTDGGGQSPARYRVMREDSWQGMGVTSVYLGRPAGPRP